MAFSIVVSEEAEFQMNEAYEYYRKIDAKLAEKFDVELRKSMNYIAMNPLFFQKRYREIRIALIEVIPFSIHYLLKDNTIFVLKILHQKQFYK